MADEYEGWAIVEQLGHRRLAGYIRPIEQYGARMARLDIPAVGDQPARTQYLGGSSIYALHPCDEAIARAAAHAMPEPPVSRWELQRAIPATATPVAEAEACHHPEGWGIDDDEPGDDPEDNEQP